MPEKNYRKTRLVESGLNAQGGSFSVYEGHGGIYTADHLVLDGTQDDYVTELVKRRFLRKDSANKNNDYRSYKISLDGDPFIKNHSGRWGKLTKPFSEPCVFADVSDMLTVDRNIRHKMPESAMVPDFVDTRVCWLVIGEEFPDYYGDEQVPGVSYLLQVPNKAVNFDVLGVPGDAQQCKVVWQRQPYLRDVETGPAFEWLLYWRRQGEFLHFWFGDDDVPDTDMAMLIESRCYPQGKLNLPNSSRRELIRQRLRDIDRFRNREKNRRRAYWKHPTVYRVLKAVSFLFGNRLLDRWVDHYTEKDFSYEAPAIDFAAEQLREANKNQPSSDTSPLPGEDSTATRTE